MPPLLSTGSDLTERHATHVPLLINQSEVAYQIGSTVHLHFFFHYLGITGFILYTRIILLCMIGAVRHQECEPIPML
ncbi:hypothetical protein ACN38_g10994 [Penicillium nordicum]|uniref:Uncharacterized protein n=1 Tax=Penicillium nordicum TaxID=229535 RepID=A0A0M8P0Y7_9EURO|nr:hypothetical protein ACN38_g10994 [Penicillium nordicum]